MFRRILRRCPVVGVKGSKGSPKRVCRQGSQGFSEGGFRKVLPLPVGECALVSRSRDASAHAN